MSDLAFGNSEKKCFVFMNEFQKDTYLGREPGETANERNDRAIRRTVTWYKEHLTKIDSKLKAVLLTDDNDCCQKAKKEGLIAFK